MGCSARGPRTADGRASGWLRNVRPPQVGGPAQAAGPERAGKGAETTQPASRMNRPARTLTRDLVRRRHPTGASPSRRNAPGRTLSPMPSEQKGAYGGHLALSDVRHGENDPNQTACVAAGIGPSGRPVRASLHRTTAGPASVYPYAGTSGSGSGSRALVSSEEGIIPRYFVRLSSWKG